MFQKAKAPKQYLTSIQELERIMTRFDSDAKAIGVNKYQVESVRI